MKKYILFSCLFIVPTFMVASQKKAKCLKKHPSQETIQIVAAQACADPVSTQNPTSPHTSRAQATSLQNQQTAQLSTEEIKQLEDAEQTALQLSKIHELQQARLKKSYDEGWITFTPIDEPPRPTPPVNQSWIKQLTQLPQTWWQAHVSDKNRIEHFMRYAGIVKTYTILWQKMQKNELEFFIDELNASNAGEGNRWLDEALSQAVQDGHENTTRKIMEAAAAYKLALTPLTRKNVVQFLTNQADKKRKALAADNQDYALDMYQLALTIQKAEFDQPKMPEISVELIEQSAKDTALALTKCATGGYLPRSIAQK